jgi:hypothetical protein
MKEYKFEKDVWFIIKGDTPYAALLKEGESITSVNEVAIFEDETSWKSEKSKLGIIDIEKNIDPIIEMPKVKKDKSERGIRIPR